MGEYLVWLLVSGLTMGVLYACYRLVLSRLRQASFNRFILLAIYAVSFLSLFIYRIFDFPLPTDEPIRVVGVSSVSKASLTTANMWLHIIFWVYVAGAMVILVRRIWNHIDMHRIISKGERSHRDGYVIVTVDDEKLSPFSWRKYIVVGRLDLDEDSDMILAHELSHLKARHWIDLLVADLVQIVQWFNPVAWIMRDELKDVHEFQADERVVYAGYDLRKYQLMLIGKVIGRKVCFVGNNLNHGRLKRRLSMLNVRPSGKGAKLRAVIFVPVVVVLAVLANNPESKMLSRDIIATFNFHPENTIQINSNDSDGPTVFVDGNRMDMQDLDQINPSEIKAITVRKDQNPDGTIYIETK